MKFTEELILLLKARCPFINISTLEEDRLEYTVRKSVQFLLNRSVYTWDFIDGYSTNPKKIGFAKRNPLEALEFIESTPSESPAIFILKDFHKFMGDTTVSRKLKNLVRILKIQPKTLIFLSPEIDIPYELKELFTIIEFPLPQKNEIRDELTRLLQSLDQKVTFRLLEILTQSCQGFSLERIRRVLSKIIAINKKMDQRAVNIILEEKSQLIRQTEILEFWPTNEKFSSIGGLKNLKNWLLSRSNSFSEKASNYGLPAPRGLLLVGIQGTGKSLTAKAIAHDWKLPLLRLDVGRLFGGLVGESEYRIRQMIQISESLSPCVLWIDEIDKAFKESNGDSGTSNRVFSTFLTWLSEKVSPVFVVATANNMYSLPLEILRKGRFDEIFFIGLPNFEERKIIFKIHLSTFRPQTWERYDLNELSLKTNYFSGAEIKQAIIEGMHFGFNEKREFTTQDIKNGIKQIIPLAQVDPSRTQDLQDWAFSGRIRIASNY